MKTNNLIKICGSITKEESLVPIHYNILKNTYVVEANNPYSDYYGMVAGQQKPNSLYLFTKHHYSLEEILRFAQGIDSCYMENVSVATAIVDFMHHKYPAIRVKYFPDYEHIHLLQACCINEGIEFSKKIHTSDFAFIKVDKCFVLEKMENGIYIDKIEDNKGYFITLRQISDEMFSDILVDIRNNEECELFDAARGGMIIDSVAYDVVRIYSENLTVELLKCIQARFLKVTSRMQLI